MVGFARRDWDDGYFRGSLEEANRVVSRSGHDEEELLLDAMAGDATLFARREEVEEAWRFIDHIERGWHEAGGGPPMARYAAGSWGPKEADELLAADGRTWRRL